MSILVTGAPGWLGTRLVEILRERQRPVRCLVMPGADADYLEKLGGQAVRGDLPNAESLKGLCDGIQTVFHCAGIIHPRRVREFYEINDSGTKNLLGEAIRAGVRKFIHISSNSVAGLNLTRDRLLAEQDAPRPYMNYGLSKLRAEEAVNQAHRDGKIQTTILRPCWFYGIRQPDRQTTFFRMIKKGNPIIFGDGQNLRSMSYIDNVIDAMLLAEQKDIAAGKTYWVADGRAYPTLEIYRTVARLLGVRDLRPRFVPAPVSSLCAVADAVIQKAGLYIKEIHVAGEMDKDIACDISKAGTELGYEPKVDLEEGMRRSIEWCAANGVVI